MYAVAEGVHLEFVPSRAGYLLLIDGYTYWRDARSKYSINWYCSKRYKKCTAFVKTDHHHSCIIASDLFHNHELPVKYVRYGKSLLVYLDGYTYSRCNKSHYVCSRRQSQDCHAILKLTPDGKWIEGVFGSHQHPEENCVVSSDGSLIKLKGSVQYTFIPTNRGKQLLMINGNTYSQANQTNNYYCSKRQAHRCRAKVMMNITEGIAEEHYEHTHPPSKHIKMSNEYTFVTSHKGKPLLLWENQTYFQNHNTTRYYCTKRYTGGCKATVKMDTSGQIVIAEGEHFHEPPRYVMSLSGQYRKVRSGETENLS